MNVTMTTDSNLQNFTIDKGEIKVRNIQNGNFYSRRIEEREENLKQDSVKTLCLRDSQLHL